MRSSHFLMCSQRASTGSLRRLRRPETAAENTLGKAERGIILKLEIGAYEFLRDHIPPPLRRSGSSAAFSATRFPEAPSLPAPVRALIVYGATDASATSNWRDAAPPTIIRIDGGRCSHPRTHTYNPPNLPNKARRKTTTQLSQKIYAQIEALSSPCI